MAAKKQEQAEKAAANPKKEAKVEEEVDPTKYTENRKNYLQSLRDKQINPYPHKFQRTHRIDEFR